MGGEGGIGAIVGGLAMFADNDPQIAFILHGDRSALEPAVARKQVLAGRVEIRHSDKVIPMTEKPSHALRNGKGSSMWNAVECVKDGDAAVAVSCGNTGALMAVSMLVLRKAPGVHRPAIAVNWPSRNPSGFNIMLDMGADIRAEARDLVTYAVMGAAYARHGMDLAVPRVGLLNVGTEEHKGRDALHEAAEILDKNQDAFTYVGFVEGSDIPSDTVDVIVTDGFTGNVALKTGEGTASLISQRLREAFSYSIPSKIATVLAYTSLKRFQQRIDPRRVNGGVFLGLNGTVVKSHGAADATGVAAATNLAFRLAQSGFSDRLAKRIAASTQHAAQTIAEENPSK